MKNLKNKYTCVEVIETIIKMYMLEIKGDVFIPTLTRTDLTDEFHEALEFRLENNIIYQKKFRKMLRCTKKIDK